jgi:cation transport ATPase
MDPIDHEEIATLRQVVRQHKLDSKLSKLSWAEPTSIDRWALIHTCSFSTLGLLVSTIPWVCTNSGTAKLYTEMGVVLWAMAYPRALLMAKQFPFWYSVASLAQTGCLHNDHIQMLSRGDMEQGSEMPDRWFNGIFAPSARKFKRTGTQNLWMAIIGKLLTLVALCLLHKCGGRPWHALVIEGMVMVFIIHNGNR